MNWVDLGAISVLLFSAAFGMFRGFVKELSALLGLVVSVWLAFTFSPEVALMLADWVDTPSIRLPLAFIGLLILATLLSGLLSRLLVSAVSQVGFSGVDRALGMLFGILRGAAIVAFVIFIAEKTPITEHKVWQNSFHN